MKSKRPLIIGLALFFCLCLVPLTCVGIGYIYLQTQPPSALNAGGYYVRLWKVYYKYGFPEAAFEIPSADPGSFKILDSSYALDKSRVYLFGVAIPEADPRTFTVGPGDFSTDANHVYDGREIFSDDPEHFEVMIYEFVARDSHHIYWVDRIISDDPSHLVVIGEFEWFIYFKDSKTVFVLGNPIQGADPASFQVIGAGYSRDAARVFYSNQLLPKADPASFEFIEGAYGRDQRAAYWMGKIIPEADSKTFRILNADFECTADAQHAYYRDMVIQNVDVNSIPPGARATNCSEDGVSLYP